MFGYVMPLKCECKVRDYTLYQAYYCGLCKTIHRRYGQLPRFVLDYDCTFLGLLLAGIHGTEPCTMERCGFKPLKKKQPVAVKSQALDYAADINVLLAWYKCADDWNDEHKFSALVGRTALNAAAKKAEALQPKAALAIKAGIAALSELEANQVPGIDAAADTFAGLLRTVFASAPELTHSNRIAMEWIGYHLGRWIYLMDAWEDREKDRKENSYNPFNLVQADQDRASFLLYISLSEAEKAYQLLTLKANQGILDNIMYLGCRDKTRRLLEGNKR